MFSRNLNSLYKNNEMLESTHYSKGYMLLPSMAGKSIL